ncbi:MAG: DUF2240 family protein [Candidatus Heimdallarchaeota archaeon]|nr:DUF2240 family protein [Candidatus Heimdallarchaeota archaeon]
MPYEKVVERIVKETQYSEKKVKKLVREKIKELGGLITHDGAAHIIARDLGINLYDSLQTSKPRLVTIGNLIGGMYNISQIALIKEIQKAKSYIREDITQGKVQHVTLIDKSATCRLVLWDDQIKHFNDLKLQSGTIIGIINAYTQENFNDQVIEIHLSNRSQIKTDIPDVAKVDFPKSLLKVDKLPTSGVTKPVKVEEVEIEEEIAELRKKIEKERSSRLVEKPKKDMKAKKIKEQELVLPIQTSFKTQTGSSITIRDKKHAYLQNYVLSTKFFKKEEQKVEYRFDHYSLRGRIDIIKWGIKNGKRYIILFEVKSEIVDLQETIGRIHDYRSYLSMDVDPLFGKMPDKNILTYLVLPEKEENRVLINEYNHMFKASDIDYIMLINTKTDDCETLTKDQL